MKCYYDESVGGQSDEWLAIVGFVAADATWAKFQKDWPVMLNSRDPVAPYVRMTEVLTGNGPFKRELGWTKDKLEQLVWDAAGVLASMDQRTICGIACAVNFTIISAL